MAADETHSDKLDDDLTDDDLESEIELVGRLVVAATSSQRSLRQDEVDHLLGLARSRDQTAAESER
jgi:hypothetical protein